MEPDNHAPAPESAQSPDIDPSDTLQWPDSAPLAPDPKPEGKLHRVFLGAQGLRAGWSILLFLILFILFTFLAGSILTKMTHHNHKDAFTAVAAFLGELAPFLGMLGAAAIVAVLERRRMLDFNLVDAHGTLHFFSGLVAGFLALSALVSCLAAGGWLHFGPAALSGAAILRFGALWAAAFLLVGCVEEGTFRCYLQFTLTRGINFWWALAILGAVCLELLLRSKGNGVWGVYAIALIGLVPCLFLHLKKTQSAGFWQAAWVSSTLFGFVHTGNSGENWIGIFAAAAIGFVFCVSVRVTGSAWWAIGCHAAWDWSETYFYGTADSGFSAQGHLLTTAPSGNPLWSGGADGPEGSLLVLGVVAALLVALLLLYARSRPSLLAAPITAEPAQ